MKNKTKLCMGGLVLLFGAVVLSGCTKSFCSVNDQAHMLYAYDYGVTNYFDGSVEGATELSGFDNIYYTVSFDNNDCLKTINQNAADSGIRTPSLNYWKALDELLLNDMVAAYGEDTSSINLEKLNEIRHKYGYLKYTDSTEGKVKEKEKVLWTNWDQYNTTIRQTVPVDECPTIDYINLYKTSMNNFVIQNRSCLATSTDDYGAYGYDAENKYPVEIEQKTWKYGWQKGFFEGLLIWPIGALTDVIVNSFANIGLPKQNGIPQLLAILVVTVIVRSVMLLATIKQTTSSAKMQSLQPEIAKIQSKYPNANTNTYEKQRLAQETSALYKKHGINPLTSLLTLIIQFPVFICVWGALQGSAALSSGELLGLRLSDSIGTIMFNKGNWGAGGGAWTALVLFLLMAGAQTVSMLLPQWIQKSKTKKVAKLGRNPAKKEQDNKMKWFTYIMLIMIIIMGFSLASAMGVYWLVGALFSIGQTLITTKINDNKSKKKGR